MKIFYKLSCLKSLKTNTTTNNKLFANNMWEPKSIKEDEIQEKHKAAIHFKQHMH